MEFKSGKFTSWTYDGDIQKAVEWLPFAVGVLKGCASRGVATNTTTPESGVMISVNAITGRIHIKAEGGYVVHLGLNTFHATTALYKTGSYTKDGEFDTVKRAQITYPNKPAELAASYSLDDQGNITSIYRAPQNTSGKLSEVFDSNGILTSIEKINIGTREIDLVDYKPYDVVVKNSAVFVISSQSILGMVYGYNFPSPSDKQHLKISKFVGNVETIGAEIYLEVKSRTASGNKGLYVKVISGGVTVEEKMMEPPTNTSYDIFGVIDAKISPDGTVFSLLCRAVITGAEESTYTRNSTNSATETLYCNYNDVFDIVLKLNDNFTIPTPSISIVEEGTFSVPISPSITINTFRQKSVSILNEKECTYTQYYPASPPDNIYTYNLSVNLTNGTDVVAGNLGLTVNVTKNKSTFTNKYTASGSEYFGYRYKNGIREWIERTWIVISDAVTERIAQGSNKISQYKGVYEEIGSLSVSHSTSPSLSGYWVESNSLNSALSSVAISYSTALSYDKDTRFDFELLRLGFVVGNEILGFAGAAGGAMFVAPENSAYNKQREFTLQPMYYNGAIDLGRQIFCVVTSSYTVLANKGEITYQGNKYSASLSGGSIKNSLEIAQYPQINIGTSAIVSELAYYPLSTPTNIDVSEVIGMNGSNFVLQTTQYPVGFNTPTYKNYCVFDLIDNGISRVVSNTSSNITQSSTVSLINESLVYPNIFNPAFDNPISNDTVIKFKENLEFSPYANGCYGLARKVDNERTVITYTLPYSLLNETKFPVQFQSGNSGRSKVIVLKSSVFTDIPEISPGQLISNSTLNAGIGVTG